MKKRISFLVALGLFTSLLCSAQANVRTQTNTAFTFGEKITYKIKYSLHVNVSVGEVNFEVADKPETIAGNSCYHITASGGTYSFYDKIFKVRDKYETYIETTSILPLVFIRDVEEGGYKFSEYVLFNHTKSMCKSRKRTHSIPQMTQDMVSSIYYARTLDYTNAKEGQAYYMNTLVDDSVFRCGVKFVKRENIKTDMGTFRCIKLKPILIVGRVFKSEEDMSLWVTDDANHIPVKIESGISVGKIKAEISTYSGLKSPMTSKK